ncbi:MAG: hypothetical protein KAX50_05415 [Saprospiraceae bacterium]|nr:hypothetical protein [Saprospiraceae bacterium]
MRKLYFTIGVKATEITHCDVTEKVDISDLFNRYPDAFFHVPDQNLFAILNFIDSSAGDVLIANVAESISIYLKLKKEVLKRNISISRVFVKIPVFTEEDLNKMYVSSSRPEYSLEELRLLAIDYQEKIKDLAAQIEKEGDDVIILPAPLV